MSRRKISQLESAVDVTANDLLQIVDVEDENMAPSGTNKKVTANLLADELGKLMDVTSTGSTTARSIANRFADVVNVKDFGAVGDGVTDDTAAIQAAISYCVANSKALFWPDGEYVTTSSLTSYWTIPHTGFGRIKRGSDTWYITPTGTQRNILYVNAAGNSANDGFTASDSLPMSAAITRFRDLGAKAAGGIWRIQIQGTITWNGVRVRDWPAFANDVEIFGEAANLNSVPTAVWDGTSAAEPYAFRAENDNAVLFLHFRNIKFTNWSSGAIVVWASGKNLCENIHTDNCPVGLWFRQNYTRVTHGVIENASTYGVSMQYSGSGNVGNLSGGGVTFKNCGRGVTIGRTVTAYIQGCTFDGNFTQCIEVTRNSRIRTQSNNFTAVNTAHDSFVTFVRASVLGSWTPDNFTGNPDLYPTLLQTAPAMLLESGSVHPQVQRGGSRNVHLVSDGNVVIENENNTQILVSSRGTKAEFSGQVAGMTENVVIRANISGTGGNSITLTFDGVDDISTALATWNTANASNQATLISGSGGQVPDNGEQIVLSSGAGNPSWVPFRLPSFYLYNREVAIDADVTLALATGAGGTLALHGASDSNTVELASITIAPVASFTRGLIQMRVYNAGGSNTWRSVVSFPEIGFYEEKTTANFNLSAIRTNSENLLLFRFYWTPSSDNTATFINMRSYVEG